MSKVSEMTRVRKRMVEHPFGTLNQRFGATHFLARKLVGGECRDELECVRRQLERIIKIIGTNVLMEALSA